MINYKKKIQNKTNVAKNAYLDKEKTINKIKKKIFETIRPLCFHVDQPQLFSA